MKTETSPSIGVLERGYKLIISLCGILTAIIFGLMSLLIGFDVIFRNLGYDFIPSSVELSEYMLMIATFVGAPWVLHQNGHIRIDVITNKLPKYVNSILDAISNLLGLIICTILMWQSWIIAQDNLQSASLVFKVLVFPEWWLNIPLLFASTLLAIEFVLRLAQSVNSLRQKGH